MAGRHPQRFTTAPILRGVPLKWPGVREPLPCLNRCTCRGVLGGRQDNLRPEWSDHTMSDGQPQPFIEVGEVSIETPAKEEARRRNAKATLKYRGNLQDEWKKFANEAHTTYANSQLSDEWQKVQNHLIRSATEAAQKNWTGGASVRGTLEPLFAKISEDVQAAALAGGTAPKTFMMKYRDQHDWEAPTWHGPRAQTRGRAPASAQPQHGLPSGLTSAARSRPGPPPVETWPLPPSHAEPAPPMGQRPQVPHLQPGVPFGGILPLPVPSRDARSQGGGGAPLPRLHDYVPTAAPQHPAQPGGSDIPLRRTQTGVPFNRVLPPLVRNDAASQGYRSYSPPPGPAAAGRPGAGQAAGQVEDLVTGAGGTPPPPG